jgi:hypothetical protein
MEYILDEKGYKCSSRLKPIKYIINNECWENISHITKNAYVQLYRNKKWQYIHRYVYELYNGIIPENHVVMHTCDNPRCINPKHLITGTQQDNMDDMNNKGRGLKGRKLTEQHKKLISIKTKEKTPKGFNHPNAIKKEKVLLIEEKLMEETNEGWVKKYERISKELGVSLSTVRRIKEKRFHHNKGDGS